MLKQEHIPPRQNIFLGGFTGFAVFAGALIVIGNKVLPGVFSYDFNELLVIIVLPLFYAVLHYPPRVHRISLVIITIVTAGVVYLTTNADTDSLYTVAVFIAFFTVAAEFIYKFVSNRQQFEAERKRAEEALRKSEERVSALFQNTTACILFIEERVIRYVNQSTLDIFGYTEEELCGQETSLIHASPEKYEERGKAVYSHLQEHGFWKGEWPYRKKNGEVLWMDTYISAMPTGGIVAVLHDITERKRIEEALQRSEQHYRLLADNLTDVIWTTDMNLRYTYLSPSVENLLGFTVEEQVSKTLEQRITPASNEFAKKVLAEELAIEASDRNDLHRSGTMEIEQFRKDGSTVWTEVNMTFLRGKDDRAVGVLGVTRDITERKQALTALMKSESRFRNILKESRDLAYKLDLQSWTYDYISPASEIVMGFTSSEFMAMGFEGVEKRIHPEDRERCQDHFNQLLNHEKIENEDIVPTIEYRWRHKDNQFHWYSDNRNLIFDKKNNPIAMVGSVRDITKSKHLEEQLRQSQKMDAIGQLSGGVAHDFNNLLTGIIGNLSLAEMKAPTEIQDYLKNAKKATDRAGELVKHLLAFSRKSQVELKPVDLNRMVKETFQLARQAIDRRIEMKIQIFEECLYILADEAQVNSMIMNLLLNARDAIDEMRDGERTGDTFVITVCTRIQTRDSYAVVRVSDNGIGMDSETQERIFEPFFTTKEVGKGTGLGLTTVYGIVKKHDGRIEIDSERGKGTTFRIYLPIVTKQDSEEEEESGEIPGGTETILLVDDEEMIRDLGKNILEQWGYTVLLASDGQEGLNAFLQNQARIDLVILDLSMPKMSGREVLTQIRSVSPEAKVAISSGYSPEGIEKEELERRGATGFLSKPYMLFEMLRTVRNLLDESR